MSRTIVTDLMKEKYSKQGAWPNKTLMDYFRKILDTSPDKAAVVAGEREMSYREIDALSNNLARNLQKLGVNRRDVVSFQLPNWPETAVLNVALSKLDVVVNPIVPIYKAKEVKFILAQAEASTMIIPSMFRGFDYLDMMRRLLPELPKLKNLIVAGGDAPAGATAFAPLLEGDGSPFEGPAPDPDSVKLLIYTSGTTAEPKGVQHTHNTLLCTALNDAGVLGLNENTVTLMPSPVTHITGYCQALEFPFIIGLKAVLMDTWDPEKALDIIEKQGCNYTVGATPFLQQMLSSPTISERKIAKPFIFLCGGAYIAPELIKRAWDVAGWETYRVYGATEAPTITLGMGGREKAAETDGMVMSYAIQLLDMEGVPAPFGREGEIVVSGPKLFAGYRDDKLNADSIGPGGWFRTGDLGVMSPEGFLQITGRKKDIIIRGGENISAAEIEDVLHTHPGVETAAAVAMPDQIMGEKVCLYLKLKPGATFSFKEMIAYVSSQKLAKQKWPERMEILNEFPMTASGKIKKNVLRKDIADKLGLPPVR